MVNSIGSGGVVASLLCDIVVAVCSTKWKWLQNKSNQLEVAVVAKVTVVLVAWWQHCSATYCGSVQHKMEVAAKNNQLEVVVVTKEAVAVVAWEQLSCKIVAAACSTKWKWLKKSTRGGSSGGGIAVVACSAKWKWLQKINCRWQ